jgi:hypothetical protein
VSQCVEDAFAGLGNFAAEERKRQLKHAGQTASVACMLAEQARAVAEKLEYKIDAAATEALCIIGEAAAAMRGMLRETEVLGCSPMAAEALKSWLAVYAPAAPPTARRAQRKGARHA